MDTKEFTYTAKSIVRGSEYAFAHHDMEHMMRVHDKAEVYAERCARRLRNVMNTPKYNFEFENQARNSHVALEHVERLMKELNALHDRTVARPCGTHAVHLEKSEYRTFDEVKEACPWAEVIQPVCGGFLVFDDLSAYETWRNTK